MVSTSMPQLLHLYVASSIILLHYYDVPVVFGWIPSLGSSSATVTTNSLFRKAAATTTSLKTSNEMRPHGDTANTILKATIEKTRGRASAFSSDDDDGDNEEEDDEDDDEEDDEDINGMTKVNIATLEKLMHPKRSSSSSTTSTSRKKSATSSSKQQRTNGNTAMHDPQFLRKRTTDLLKMTEYATATPTATNGPVSTDTDKNDSKDVTSSITSSLTTSSSSSTLSRNMKVEKKTFHFLLDAWAFSDEPDAAQQAMTLLQRLEELGKLAPATMQPDVRSYTKTMNAIARQKSPLNGTATGALSAGEQAEALLYKLKELYMAASLSNPELAATTLKPNAYTYTAVIQAHANSAAEGSPERADWWLTEKMVDQYQRGDDSVRPTTKAFNAVIYAYGKAGNAEKAQAVFKRMEALYETSVGGGGGAQEDFKPNAVNYNALIAAWANCDQPDSALRAEAVLERMEYLGDSAVQPTTVSYNAVIDTWAKSGEETAAYKAEELLRRMDQLYEAGNRLVQPNTRSFNAVMNAWAKSRDPDADVKAAELLQLMEKRYEQGDTEVRPDVHSFCTVINAYARSTKADKAELAYNLYQDMKTLYQAGNTRVRPNVVAVNAVMNACAFTTGDIRQQNRAVEIAHSILKDLEKSPYGQPDQVTYLTFMKTCANQMPDSHTRQQIVEVLFRKCCRDGQFGSLVLQQLKCMTSGELYKQLIGRNENESVRIEDLPKEWSCNVVEGKLRRRRPQS